MKMNSPKRIDLKYYIHQLKNHFKFISLLTTLSITACGGGGSGGENNNRNSNDSTTPSDDLVDVTPQILYNGNTNYADITPSNAGRLLNHLLGDLNSQHSSIATKTVTPPDSTSSLGTRKDFTNIRQVTALIKAQIQKPSDIKLKNKTEVNQVIQCENADGNGSIKGSLDDSGNGTVNFYYSNCLQGESFINGNGQVTFSNEQITQRFGHLRLSDSESSIAMSGHIVYTESADGEHDLWNVSILAEDSGEISMLENLSITYRLDGYSFSNYEEYYSYSGRVFDSEAGYFDVETPQIIHYPGINSTHPISGTLLIQGRENSQVRLSFTDENSYPVSLNTVSTNDSNLTYYLSTNEFLNLTQVDLSDSDHDGMHDSWERQFGLSVNTSDAQANSDDDLFSNYEEYLRGSSPNDSLSPEVEEGATVIFTTSAAQKASLPGYPGFTDIIYLGEEYAFTVNLEGAKVEKFSAVIALPDGFELVSIESGNNTCEGTQEIICSIPQAENNDDISPIDIRIRANSNSSQGIHPIAIQTDGFVQEWRKGSQTQYFVYGQEIDNLQAQIETAQAGDTIYVPPGAYIGPLVIPKELHLISQEGPEKTFLIGTHYLVGTNGHTTNPVTITNAGAGSLIGFFSVSEYRSYIEDATSFTFKNNRFMHRFPLTVSDGTVSVEANMFHPGDPAYDYEPAIETYQAQLDIKNNIFEEFKHALAINNNSRIQFVNNTVINARVAISYGTNNSDHHLDTYQNNVFFHDDSYPNEKILFDFGNSKPSNYPSLSGNNYFNYEIHCKYNDHDMGNCGYNSHPFDSETADPMFVDPDNGNYQLSSQSPLIDSGEDNDVNTDFNGEPRPIDGNNNGVANIDIGAFEYRLEL